MNDSPLLSQLESAITTVVMYAELLDREQQSVWTSIVLVAARRLRGVFSTAVDR